MAASSVRGRPMVVEKARLAEILFDAVKDGLQFITGTLPFAILTSDSPFVLIPNTCSSFLYTLRNPVFEPAYIPTMSHVAIGSGRGVAEDVHRVHARILFESLSNPGLSAHWFRNAVSAFAERNNIKSVGGLYPIIRVSADAFEYIGQTTITHRQGTSEIEAHVTLSIENECWVQRNITNQKEIFLKYPWDVLKCPQRSVLFDDIDRRRWSQRLTENNGDPAKLEAS